MHEPNPDVRPTGEEAGEYVEDLPGERDEDEDVAPDPERRSTGSPPVAREES
jgi:hypothetical protein